ncbi:MAG TPA: LAGLIDADG family homing endonuclease, partial [Candidatus Competibacteraceae bacterium]|nr:LAGLIDADG family homing endonuclease [Candidatus Competibacteraceae bacterium]
LAEVEATPELCEHWYERFLYALRRGAIPAGRIISNAGAWEHKPATSTINCTVSGTIEDSMDDILQKVHEAGLTLKAGCVAPGTWVYTEHGLVTADQAVAEKHAQILCYDREARRFEMRAIERHLTTRVARTDNIEIQANGVSLKTSIRHPVLVYRDGKLCYVRADEVGTNDALVQYRFPWAADAASALSAWFAGAHLGDGGAYEKRYDYAPSRQSWAARAQTLGRRLVFKIRAAEREVVERYAEFFQRFSGSRARVVSGATVNGSLVWDYTVSSFAASRAAELIDQQIGAKTAHLRVPLWIVRHPERHFLPFLAGLIDTDGTVCRERGSVTITTQNVGFAAELQALLGLFGVHGAITLRKPRNPEYRGREERDSGGAMLKLSDSAFLAAVARYMADSGKRGRILEHASQAGQCDRYLLPAELRQALREQITDLDHQERQQLGFYHGYHEQRVVSRIWLERWAERFPALQPLIEFARTLRPVQAIRRNLELPEIFYDFTVEQHNNYLAGNNGLLVIHNCGIGYEFSTLRPRGAYVSGAGAYTSGPLSFMDIYDKMCFTVSSAGGRRGAQMGTFDVGHPDVLDFIKAKREAGRLRQFNLSLLITKNFMEAVKADADWPLAFPIRQKEAELDGIDVYSSPEILWRDWPTHEGLIVNEQGLVACKIYRHIKARRLWDVIMSSTYDYAEPGFILIDQYNEMNNNWWCENIRATNPCVTADTWVQTAAGPRQVSELLGRPFLAVVDGELHATGPEGFFFTATKPVVRVQTREGYSLRLTADHRVRRVTRYTCYTTETEWCAAAELRPGDRVLLNDHRALAGWAGACGEAEGYLIGLLIGNGTLKDDEAVLSAWMPAALVNGDVAASGAGVQAMMAAAEHAARQLPQRTDFQGWRPVAGRNEYRLSLAALRDLASKLGLRCGAKAVTPAMERASSEFYRGFLRGLFDTDGSVQGSQSEGVSVRLTQSDVVVLEAVQRMLLRLGIVSQLYRERRLAGHGVLPDGRGGGWVYATRAQPELVISGENLLRFREIVGFADGDKQARLDQVLGRYRRNLHRERFVAVVEMIDAAGVEDVYDVRVPGINSFDANGLHAHNCGEQGLPPYGACLLGSVNLTKFVLDPFTDNARFDWDGYREVVAIFTRMLDNVVEISGLPLERQRQEILSKRRHGMGYLGLGSTLTLLKMKYGTPESLAFTEQVTREMAVTGWKVALELAREKGPAPLLEQEFAVTAEMLRKRPELARDGYKVGDKVPGKVLHARYSRYMQRIAEVEPELVEELAKVGARFTHHTSIAPTGTISLSLANNASNGIEPSFAHHYSRNIIREGKKTKEKVDVYSYELLAYRYLINPHAMPFAEDPEAKLPEYFVAADDITPKEHVDVQAAAQKWIDSSISKTINVPTDFPYEKFKDVYLYAYEQGLKGCTTFRFNPEAFQGVLVKEQDLENTLYTFTLEDGSQVTVKGNEEIEYDGEVHTAANLFDALKEGYYGKF